MGGIERAQLANEGRQPLKRDGPAAEADHAAEVDMKRQPDPADISEDVDLSGLVGSVPARDGRNHCRSAGLIEHGL